MSAWKPISTAPKDGTHIWAYTSEGRYREVWWAAERESAPDDIGHDAGWFSRCGETHPKFDLGDEEGRQEGDQPTDWQPLPAPPVEEAEGLVAGGEQGNSRSELEPSSRRPSPPAEVRQQVIEECAKVADGKERGWRALATTRQPHSTDLKVDSGCANTAKEIARDIRALLSLPQGEEE